MTSTAVEAARPVATTSARRRRRRTRPSRVALHAFLIVAVLLWASPILWAIFTALRPYADTAAHGYVSWPSHLSFANFRNAYTESGMLHYFWNSIIVSIPAIFLILLFSSAVACVVSRYSYWFNVPLLIFFMAANLLPQQVVLQPLYRVFLWVPLPTWLSDSGYLYDSYVGLIAINVAFQTGFCTFVLANYMKTLPKSLSEAARVDGAGVLRQYFQIVLPLCKPALAALATLEFTFIYNDFLWALILVPDQSKQPITAALNNLQGEFFTDNNLLAAGALLTAIPTVLVFVLLQRHFVRGLTLGARKG
jgi:multiple sugar transport system permease protein